MTFWPAAWSVTQAIKIDARKEYRSHAKMDEIDETSLERVAAAHDALDLSWLDDTRPPADQFVAFRALKAGDKAKLVAYATASTTQSCFARDRCARQPDACVRDRDHARYPRPLDAERGALQSL